MITKSNEITRRILNFPAIRPCESVSYTTLIASLINLGRSICGFKSRTFFTNKKKSRTSIRLIETLVLFLTEIQDTDSCLDVSVFLGLSELHFIFQKVHFLLEDCTRDNARSWILMNSDKVSTHFRELTKSIAVALDVLLPLESISPGLEVEEIAEFVRKQVLKTRFDVEKDDRRVVRKVFRVMEQFERGIAPESNDLKRVLEYLGITTWEECNKEIDFLEKDLGQACDKRELGSVSSLISYMIYCRCTIFHDYKATTAHESASVELCNSEIIKCLNPEDFKCPITLEIMKDPVTVSTGHTYDRSSILKWFGSGNHTCPKTGERLKSLDLVNNRALERLISLYCKQHRIPSVESRTSPDHRETSRSSLSNSSTVVSEQAMTLLSRLLVRSLANGTDEDRTKAAYEIRLLTKTSNFNRSCLVEADVIPHLLNMLCSSASDMQENAVSGLLNLSRYSRSKKIIVENGGLEQIVSVLTDGLDSKARQHAAGTLFHLSSVREYRRKIGGIQGLIPGLMGLLYEKPDRAKKNALVTMLRLLTNAENHWSFLSSGLVPSLIHLLTSSDNEDLMADSLSILATLADKLDGAMAIVSAGTLDIVVKILCSSDSRTAKEHCVSLLLALCINDQEDVVHVLAKNHSLMGSLYSVLVDGSGGSKKKASSVIRILHEFNEKSSPSSGFLRDFHREQFVHAW